MRKIGYKALLSLWGGLFFGFGTYIHLQTYSVTGSFSDKAVMQIFGTPKWYFILLALLVFVYSPILVAAYRKTDANKKTTRIILKGLIAYHAIGAICALGKLLYLLFV